MAKGKKTGGRDFEPGHKFSKGRPPLPLNLKEVKPLTKDTYIRMFSKYLEMPLDELEYRLEERSLPALEHIMAAAIHQTKTDGNISNLRDPFDRTLGKVTENVSVEMVKPFIVTRRDGTEVVMGQQIVKHEGSEDDETV